jgi:hypothetical protein
MSNYGSNPTRRLASHRWRTSILRGTGLRNSYGLIFSTRSEGSLRALPALHTGTPPKAAHRYDSAETEARRHIKLPKLFLSSLAT